MRLFANNAANQGCGRRKTLLITAMRQSGEWLPPQTGKDSTAAARERLVS